ncbi:MAG: hypothetical protein M0041_00285 [Nitrospiraceae bacterium]|nr:hypothetical protein [Nitrospiraceae bacterium]
MPTAPAGGKVLSLGRGEIAGETMRYSRAELAMYGGESFRGLRAFGDGQDRFRHRVRGTSGS